MFDAESEYSACSSSNESRYLKAQKKFANAFDEEEKQFADTTTSFNGIKFKRID